MIIDYVIANFEIIVFISLSLIVISCILIFYLQNNFISITSKNLEKLSTSIKSSNLELADYLKTLSSVLEDNKNNIEKMAEKINSLEKEVTRMTDVKGTDDMLSLAIELARNGEEKEIIKEKTGLTDDEIDTLHAYHRNLKV
tara:strand:- start:589 stop:1014 length:426 start_codon:yes stop_codon:yes gene_type:complete